MKSRSLMTAICILATANIVSAAPFAYVANSGTKNVTVIDTADNSIKATVPLPDTQLTKHPYAYGVTVGASGQYAYVGLQTTNEVIVIDTTKAVGSANAVIKRIGLNNDFPGGLAVNAAETRLYVASKMSNELLVIDITGSGAAELERVVLDPVNSISNPEGVVLNPAGDKAYVANSLAGTIAEVSLDEANNVYTRTNLIPLGANAQPMGLAISSDGAKLYAASLNGNASVVNTATREVTNLTVEPDGMQAVISVAITPDNSKIYAPSAGFNNMNWINGTNNVVTALGGQNSLLNSPWGSAVTPVVSPAVPKLYVAMNLSDNVKVFDTSTDLVTETISLPAGAKPTSFGNFIGPLLPYTITSAKTTNCSISPLGITPVNNKGRLFSVSALSNQCEVFVGCDSANPAVPKTGEISQGFPSSYIYTDVTANGEICARNVTGTFYTLTASWVTTVGGYLVSSPAGINANNSSAKFLGGAGKNVAITAGEGFKATNWTGACAGTPDGDPCTFNDLAADKSFGATVIIAPPVVLGGSIYNETKGTYYQAWAECPTAATVNDYIKISTDITDLTTTGASVALTLSNQWDKTNYSNKGSYVPMTLTITDGTVIAGVSGDATSSLTL